MALYAYCREDGSWFGADNLSVINVPDEIKDADEVEDYLNNCDLDEEDLFDPSQLKEL